MWTSCARRQTMDMKLAVPTNASKHALFSVDHLRKHYIMDLKWTADALADNYQRMNKLLTTRQVYLTEASLHSLERLNKRYHELRHEVRDGRNKLKSIMCDSSKMEIRKIFRNHKELLRLYMHLPLQQVEESVCQRTFALKKEHDRLNHRLEELKLSYLNSVQERSRMEAFYVYFKDKILEEEIKLKTATKNMQNFRNRLQAIKTINVVYKKIKHVLTNDELFYEQILLALRKDSEEQLSFIKYVIDITTPTIFELANMRAYLRKNISNGKKFEKLSQSHLDSQRQLVRNSIILPIDQRGTKFFQISAMRYQRQTDSMNDLMRELQNVESVIRHLQTATVATTPTDIIKSVRDNAKINLMLEKKVSVKDIQADHFKYKCENAKMQKGKLLISFLRDLQRNNKKINSLQSRIAKEQILTQQLMQHIKQRAKDTTTLRMALWNMYGTMHGVASMRDARLTTAKYPTSYLHLPLLKFDQLYLHAKPPNDFEPNIITLYQVVKEKILNLCREYDAEVAQLKKQNKWTRELVAKYNRMSEKVHASHMNVPQHPVMATSAAEEDPIAATDKASVSPEIPTRSMIKALSLKIVADHLKLNDGN